MKSVLNAGTIRQGYSRALNEREVLLVEAFLEVFQASGLTGLLNHASKQVRFDQHLSSMMNRELTFLESSGQTEIDTSDFLFLHYEHIAVVGTDYRLVWLCVSQSIATHLSDEMSVACDQRVLRRLLLGLG